VSRIRARLYRPLDRFDLQVDLDVPAAGITALYGPSGSGKTTLLRCLAGLERAAGGGSVQIGDLVWQDDQRGHFVPTHRRALAYVFQDAYLFPHLDVAANLQYGMRRTPRARRHIGMGQAVAWLGLEDLLHRQPQHLSGGERQRVAIARALLTGPQVLLMDEPLSALDARSKDEILGYLEALHRDLTIPMLYVTHAAQEVQRLADRVVYLESGRIRWVKPVSEAAVDRDWPVSGPEDGTAAVVEATLVAYDETDCLAELSFAGGRLLVPRASRPEGERHRLRIPARDVSLALEPPARTSILNVLKSRITDLRPYRAGQVIVALEAGQWPLLAQVTARSATELELTPGMQVYAQIKGVAFVS